MSDRRDAAGRGTIANSIPCPFCQSPTTYRAPIALRFRQMTRLGFVYCRAVVPATECRACGGRWVDRDADDLMDEAVERAYRALETQKEDDP